MSAGCLSGKSLALQSLSVAGQPAGSGLTAGFPKVVAIGTASWNSSPSANFATATLAAPLPSGTFVAIASWFTALPVQTIGIVNPAGGATVLNLASSGNVGTSTYAYAVIQLS